MFISIVIGLVVFAGVLLVGQGYLNAADRVNADRFRQETKRKLDAGQFFGHSRPGED